jgi:TadE-like protein
MRPAARKRRFGNRRNSTVPEFSLAFTAFIMLLMALMEFGRVIWTFRALLHAASQGARDGSVHGGGNPIMINGTDDTVTAIGMRVKNNAVGLDSNQVVVDPV